jgi:hypothetical protein
MYTHVHTHMQTPTQGTFIAYISHAPTSVGEEHDQPFLYLYQIHTHTHTLHIYISGPDRYVVSDEPSPQLGWLRCIRFNAYKANKFHCLEAPPFKGGWVPRYRIHRGHWCPLQAEWSCLFAFYAFESDQVRRNSIFNPSLNIYIYIQVSDVCKHVCLCSCSFSVHVIFCLLMCCYMYPLLGARY